MYSRSSLNGHSRKRTALFTALTKPRLNSILAHTNSVFTHSRKRSAPVADAPSASRGCPLTGTSTVQYISSSLYVYSTSWNFLFVLEHHTIDGSTLQLCIFTVHHVQVPFLVRRPSEAEVYFQFLIVVVLRCLLLPCVLHACIPSLTLKK